MIIEQGSVHNAEQIAQIYIEAFPTSIQRFFSKKAHSKLLKLLTHSFALLLLTGAEVVLARTPQGKALGYCIYTSAARTRSRAAILVSNSRKILSHTFNLFRHIHVSEFMKLVYNAVLVKVNTTQDQKLPRKCGRINSIAVSPRSQGLGVGTKLLNLALTKLADQNVFLSVRPDNHSAKKLYLKAGFRECGTTKDLQGSWILMIRQA
ncbi:MAG: GNAT family N-acetyltransferase [Firmicutes bacterium]|jgi:ribosomal protein S18 acetylase RimI-like enzyme|nr:GNAT family N-acetyltransferase [Bacillota bacterium]